MKLRSPFLAVAFAAIVGAAITGAALTAETRESSLDQSCRYAAWPQIPAQCLLGDVKGNVRVIPIESSARRAMNTRFAVAFEEVSGR